MKYCIVVRWWISEKWGKNITQTRTADTCIWECFQYTFKRKHSMIIKPLQEYICRNIYMCVDKNTFLRIILVIKARISVCSRLRRSWTLSTSNERSDMRFEEWKAERLRSWIAVLTLSILAVPSHSVKLHGFFYQC